MRGECVRISKQKYNNIKGKLTKKEAAYNLASFSDEPQEPRLSNEEIFNRAIHMAAERISLDGDVFEWPSLNLNASQSNGIGMELRINDSVDGDSSDDEKTIDLNIGTTDDGESKSYGTEKVIASGYISTGMELLPPQSDDSDVEVMASGNIYDSDVEVVASGSIYDGDYWGV